MVIETTMEECSSITATTSTTESISSRVGGGEAKREESVDEEEEKAVCVAVGKDVKESSSILLWALQHLEGKKKICILHVHQPAHMIPTTMGVEIAANLLEEAEVRAYRDIEKTKKDNTITKYLQICARVGVQAQNLDIDSDNVEKGIVSLIAEHGIHKLIMGAAADKRYTKRMTKLKSKKAIFVNEHAHACCNLWFVCNGCLILKREVGLEGRETGVVESALSVSTQRDNLKSKSFSAGLSEHAKVSGLMSFISRIRRKRGVTTVSSLGRFKDRSVLQEHLASEGSADGWGRISRKSSAESSTYSTCLSSEEVIGSLEPMSHAIYATCHSSSLLEEGGVEDEMCNQLQQARSEAKDSVREAFQESRCPRAEKDALKAKWNAKTLENLCPNEVRRRQKMEKTSLDQCSALGTQVADSDWIIRELEEKMVSAMELLISIREERDQLLLERNNAVRKVEELKNFRIEEDMTSSQRPQFTPEFSFKEIEEATCSFDPSLMIGEGGYGNVYRGFLRNTEVAIKRLHSNNSQGRAEFQQEVDVLGRMRHPNLVALIGACPEAWSLIYEYLPNGSLEDRLNCKNNTPPLPWQRRICIAVEVCCALIFLHSSNPDSVIHGDIKPANILLDANFVSKLGDFGICRLVSKKSIDGTTPCCVTNPKGTPGYMDPAFLLTGDLTAKSDVYSYGVILLRLLTGRPVLKLVKDVQYAMEKGMLGTLLDATAGVWPFVHAKQLAKLALRCCDTNPDIRPDLKSEVWRMLGPMKASCGGLSSSR